MGPDDWLSNLLRFGRRAADFLCQKRLDLDSVIRRALNECVVDAGARQNSHSMQAPDRLTSEHATPAILQSRETVCQVDGPAVTAADPATAVVLRKLAVSFRDHHWPRSN